MQKSLTASTEFEELDPKDVISALQSLKGNTVSSAILPLFGAGHKVFLDWAQKDLEEARTETQEHLQARYATNCVMNARRALSCLVDSLLQREGFLCCKNPPKTADKKSEVLQQRGIIEVSTSNVLQRSIDKRNLAEHQYEKLTFTEAEDIFTVVRLACKNLTENEDERLSPFIFGSFLHGMYFSGQKNIYTFNGWNDPLVLFVSFVSQPWLGILIPSSKTQAVIRKVFLQELNASQLVEALNLLHTNFGRPTSGVGIQGCVGLGKHIGFID